MNSLIGFDTESSRLALAFCRTSLVHLWGPTILCTSTPTRRDRLAVRVLPRRRERIEDSTWR